MIIKWLASKLFPLLQTDEGMINIHKRLNKLEKDTHPPIFSREQLNIINKRLEVPGSNILLPLYKAISDLVVSIFFRKFIWVQLERLALYFDKWKILFFKRRDNIYFK